MKVLSKFAVYTGKQSRITYRIVMRDDGMYQIDEFLSNVVYWTPVYKKAFTTERELLSSVQFKNLFIPQ